ncbi:hypothetical protein WG904_08085 [Pedobacter sp. Du54]|uniref:hypothetical protein n=1 Tax=Pedobacter anseongensis TaxID=3133439 RepID=UPI0030A83BD0
MNTEDLFKKIGLILNELNTQYEFLAQNPQKLNELELDLFHANADFLSDHAQILIKVSKRTETPLEIKVAANEPKIDNAIEDRSDELEMKYYGDSLQEEQQEEITFTKEPKEIFKLDQTPSSFEFILKDSAENGSLPEDNKTMENIPQENRNQYVQNDNFMADYNKIKNDEKFEFEEKSVDELFNRPLSQEEENILAQKRKLNEISIEAPVEDDEIGPEPFLVSKTVAAEFPIEEEDLTLEEAVEPIINTAQVAVEDPSYKPTLNDLLAAKSDKGVNDSNGANRISDLKQGINLNDKLLYTKDLFNGYNLAYAEAIDLANKLPNFESADNFFKKNYAVKNNWAEKQATVDKFYALLNQRFK